MIRHPRTRLALGDPVHDTPAPGVFVTRRRLLWLPALAIAAATMRVEAQGESTGDLGWEAFLDECLPRARQLHGDAAPRGQESYLRWVSFMVSRVRAEYLPKPSLGRFRDLEPPVHFGVGYRGEPFFIVSWWMEPGAVLPPHTHPNVSVCTLGTEGEARLRNFEIVGEAPAESLRPFRVRETHDEILAPGRVNTLSAVRDNIHTFEAGPRGARGIDITTYHGPNIGFSFLDMTSQPVDGGARIYEAVWKKL